MPSLSALVFFNSATQEHTMRESHIRQAIAFASSFLTTTVVLVLSYAVLSAFLWAFLAYILSAIGAMIVGYHAGMWSATTGYDLAVSASASMLTAFRGLKAKVAS
jgi:sterol desaturase/sphingolipid hydroxylase (fatty acid hydroxylase superfamily)